MTKLAATLAALIPRLVLLFAALLIIVAAAKQSQPLPHVTWVHNQ